MDQISSIFRNFKKGQLWAFQFSLDLEVFRIPKGSPGTKEVFFCVNQIVWVLSWAAYRMKWDLRICLSFGPFWRSERRLLHIIPVPLQMRVGVRKKGRWGKSYQRWGEKIP